MLTKHHLEKLGGNFKGGIAALARFRCEPTVLLHVPRLMQMDGYSCGLQSARMVAEFHGVEISHSRVERFAKQNRDGTETNPMVAFLRANGMTVRQYCEGEARIATILDALDKGLPIIVSVPEHYLVVNGYDRNSLYVIDPSPHRMPLSIIKRPAFRRMWTREALIVTRVRSHRMRRAAKPKIKK